VEQLAALMAVGAVAGLFSGLLGVGGAFIIVPAMVFMMPHFGMAGPDLVKVAIATAMATTVVATFSGVQAHLARGAVDWSIMWRLTPGVTVGAFAGPLISEAINAQLLTILFVGFLLFAARAIVRRRGSHQTARQLPGIAALLILGVVTGAVCSLLGISTAAITVPLLASHLPIQRSIGTSSALSVPLAVVGAAGYLLADAPGATCSSGCTGYVYLAGVGAIAIAMIFTVPLGAWLTHVVPAAPLRMVFAGFLVAVAVQMTWKTLPGVDSAAYAASLRTWLTAPDAAPKPAQPIWLGEASSPARQWAAER
jgi:uncharacterized membrane protein YfcA